MFDRLFYFAKRITGGSIAILCLSLLAMNATVAADEIPKAAQRHDRLSSHSLEVRVADQTLWLKLAPSAVSERRAVIPRLCAPIRSIRLLGHDELKIDIQPEITEWIFSWKESPGTLDADNCVIEVQLDAAPVLLQDNQPTTQQGDGSILLPGYQATTFGEKLRYEPQWFKNTVGYWTVPTDYATWQFDVRQPGTFSVAILQGCGGGQGGSDARLAVTSGDQAIAQLTFQPVETGHFQNFRWIHLGFVEINSSGLYQLKIQPDKIARAAMVDIRAVSLVRQAKP